MASKALVDKAGRYGALVIGRVINARDIRHAAIERLMTSNGDSGARSQAPARIPSSVSALTVSASKRKRIADSHDGRKADKRSTVRSYSKRQLALDIERNYPNGRQSGDCITYKAPLWIIESSADSSTETRSKALAPFAATGTPFTVGIERTERTKRTVAKLTKADERRMRTAAMAPAAGPLS